MKKPHFYLLFFLLCGKISFAQEPYIGEIRIFAGNFAPLGWQFCNGSLLQIAEYDVLFNLIGTTYGGDGQTTFAVPDLRSRVPVGTGTGQGLNNVQVGQQFGTENVTLTANNLPQHTHTISVSVSNTDANSNNPAVNPNIGKTGTLSGRKFIPAKSYNTAEPDITLAAGAVTSSAGQSVPISLMKPHCPINYIISLYGIYPTQN